MRSAQPPSLTSPSRGEGLSLARNRNGFCRHARRRPLSCATPAAMDVAHRWLLLAGLLLLASILASRLTSRVGAPMLLVFLGLGMLVGEEGFGGIAFGER